MSASTNLHWRLGFSRPDLSFSTPAPADRERAIFRVRKALAEVVHDTIALEGNPITFPEVQTLLDGVTVGGHRLADAEQVLNQAASWKRLLSMVSAQRFALDMKTACDLHGLVARHEALRWGEFRTGDVSIAGTAYKPPAAETLGKSFKNGIRDVEQLPCVFARAMCAYLMVARQQFFWDGNKRTGRLLMNGVLLSHGYDAICVPAKRQLEYNTRMIAFYDTGHAEPMMRFLASCSLDNNLRLVHHGNLTRKAD